MSELALIPTLLSDLSDEVRWQTPEWFREKIGEKDYDRVRR